MRAPPPLSQLSFFPVTGGVALLAIIATVAGMTHHSIATIEMNYLAFHGEPWRLVSSIFPHANLMHLGFNLYWLWVFGSLVEEKFGHVRTAAFYVLLAAASASAEYALGIGGIGLSGVGYGLFGFFWVASRNDRRFTDAVDTGTIRLFVIWFFVCIILTVANIFPVANYAHADGAIVGALVGWIVTRRAPRRAAAALASLLVLTLWAATIGRPKVNFSKYADEDTGRLGYEALMRDDNAAALRYLRIATSMRHADATSWRNLGIACERLGMNAESSQAFSRAGNAVDDDETHGGIGKLEP